MIYMNFQDCIFLNLVEYAQCKSLCEMAAGEGLREKSGKGGKTWQSGAKRGILEEFAVLNSSDPKWQQRLFLAIHSR